MTLAAATSTRKMPPAIQIGFPARSGAKPWRRPATSAVTATATRTRSDSATCSLAAPVWTVKPGW